MSPGALAEVQPQAQCGLNAAPIQDPGVHCGPWHGEPCPLPLRMCLLALPQQPVNSTSCSFHQYLHPGQGTSETPPPPKAALPALSPAETQGVLTPLLAFWAKRLDRNRSNLTGRRAP